MRIRIIAQRNADGIKRGRTKHTFTQADNRPAGGDFGYNIKDSCNTTRYTATLRKEATTFVEKRFFTSTIATGTSEVNAVNTHRDTSDKKPGEPSKTTPSVVLRTVSRTKGGLTTMKDLQRKNR